MLIPSIDLQRGRIVQLVQGERLAIESDDIDGWVAKFAGASAVQLIDLDAAKGTGHNTPMVESICRALPCRVGGGIRTLDRADAVFAAGARKAILGSALFRNGAADVRFAASLADRFGPDRLIAAVDARGGLVVVDGWRTRLDISPSDAIRALEAYFGEFLFTNVDVEGLMQGVNREAILDVRRATHRNIAAAGGVTTQDEVDWLESIGVDAVAGMAIYSGRLKPI